MLNCIKEINDPKNNSYFAVLIQQLQSVQTNLTLDLLNRCLVSISFVIKFGYQFDLNLHDVLFRLPEMVLSFQTSKQSWQTVVKHCEG